MDDKTLEFQIIGCIYTGENKVTLGDLTEEFMNFCDSKGWELCGIYNELKEN